MGYVSVACGLDIKLGFMVRGSFLGLRAGVKSRAGVPFLKRDLIFKLGLFLIASAV